MERCVNLDADVDSRAWSVWGQMSMLLPCMKWVNVCLQRNQTDWIVGLLLMPRARSAGPSCHHRTFRSIYPLHDCTRSHRRAVFWARTFVGTSSFAELFYVHFFWPTLISLSACCFVCSSAFEHSESHDCEWNTLRAYNPYALWTASIFWKVQVFR